MKKVAGIIILGVGFTLLAMNYASSSFTNHTGNSLFFSTNTEISNPEVSEESMDVSKINLPSIFTVIIGLLK